MDDDRPVISEREVIIRLLELYRDLPGLWDPNHELYSNREARQVAYESLLEYYRKFDKEASVADLKKKLENMRAAYRREKKKVEKSLADDSRSTIHVPMLWYYQLFSFLDNDSDPLIMKSEHCSDSDNKSDEPERKKPKTPSRFATNQLIKKEMALAETTPTYHVNLTSPEPSGGESSADAFGKSISSQLKELPKLQRCLAEKLIGEVMFYAKMDQLNMDTVIYLNDGDS
ncbi:hypothetical protein PYW07_010119 [Mythimna separata]|uniref:MADF domain-containing protein n=1 Tax=Mythimna separata TaxID=271217 RepID=A0AAD8DQ97_MYTSE|nr:hypothetical protein PYW07_010119 [Mythimna separata]